MIFDNPKLAWAAVAARILQDTNGYFKEDWTEVLSACNSKMDEKCKLSPAELTAVVSATVLANIRFNANYGRAPGE